VAERHEELRKLISGEVYQHEPMQRHTSWRIGGPADMFVIPRDEEDLRRALHYARRNGTPVYVVGNGTNLLVSDKGIRGMVVKIGPGLSNLEVCSGTITAGAGVSLPRLAGVAWQHGLSGFEFLAGIPGTVGGALVMNAGANGCSIGERVEKITGLDFAGNSVSLDKEELEFAYRRSCLARRGIIVTGVMLSGIPGDRDKIKERMDYYLERRRQTQPLDLPNAGSVFKNPPGDSAGRLIELTGCKEMRVGAVQVSSRHANFFVNLGGGTASDVLALIEKVRQMVEEKCGVRLELEVQKLGEF